MLDETRITALFFFGTYDVRVKKSLNANNDESINLLFDLRNEGAISNLLALIEVKKKFKNGILT